MLDQLRKAGARIARAFGAGGSGGGAHAQRLVHLCRGDRGMAERLIAFELARAPAIDRREASRRAVERYLRDQ